ncbi:MAG: fatty acid desaturase [Candidatus Koribacter versatilis]|uniref:Fatty acid desaturase n=1 Tax=Candidatus Korobacter versatilis TaxID=658062 RepID=A0A932A8U4_9BACT|nr:fatty acid desaturase [Candidatus Koribacter versatilis]
MQEQVLDGSDFVRDKSKVAWITAIFMTLFHLGAIAALFFFSWKNVAVAVALLWVSGGWGIGMGYHRLLTHRGFKSPRWLEYFLTICGTLALEGGPLFWVATHRIHHRNSDQPGDPHSPRDGAWWSHMGWILVGESMHSDTTRLARYAPDLAKDDFYMWLTKWHWVPQVLLGLTLLAFGGWTMVLWGIFFRVTIGLHFTWLVNSATHMWGSRRYQTKDDSRNLWWVAMVSWGEGWHNNHHANPTSARHGLAWYELDINYMMIRLLELTGLAKKVKVVKLPSKLVTAPAHEAEQHAEHQEEHQEAAGVAAYGD